MPRKKQPQKVYTVRIDLAGSAPPAWRRVLVTDRMELEELHQVIQIVMPWNNSHLHEFTIGENVYVVAELR